MSTDTRTIFSLDRAYRYALWRCWGDPDRDGYLAVIGLNPSTADEQLDDPTIRRCVGFAKRECVGALCMLNIFGFRSTDPRVLKTLVNPVGDHNHDHMRRCVAGAKLIVAAWGTHGELQGRAKIVAHWLHDLPNPERIVCLGKSKHGHPKHPLYIRADQPFEPFR